MNCDNAIRIRSYLVIYKEMHIVLQVICDLRF